MAVPDPSPVRWPRQPEQIGWGAVAGSGPTHAHGLPPYMFRDTKQHLGLTSCHDFHAHAVLAALT